MRRIENVPLQDLTTEWTAKVSKLYDKFKIQARQIEQFDEEIRRDSAIVEELVRDIEVYTHAQEKLERVVDTLLQQQTVMHDTLDSISKIVVEQVGKMQDNQNFATRLAVYKMAEELHTDIQQMEADVTAISQALHPTMECEDQLETAFPTFRAYANGGGRLSPVDPLEQWKVWAEGRKQSAAPAKIHTATTPEPPRLDGGGFSNEIYAKNLTLPQLGTIVESLAKSLVWVEEQVDLAQQKIEQMGRHIKDKRSSLSFVKP